MKITFKQLEVIWEQTTEEDTISIENDVVNLEQVNVKINEEDLFTLDENGEQI